MKSIQNSLAHKLAGHVADIGAVPVDRQIAVKVRQHLVDGIASAFIGCRSRIFCDLVAGTATGDGSLPRGEDRAMVWAFAINGSVSEDGSREGACHPAAAIVPAIMAFGEGYPLDKIERALVAGYDVMIRLARAGNPLFARKGFHGTAVTAPFGVAATLAVLKGFDCQTTANALTMAALGGSGLMAAFKRGASQPLQVAWGVRNGVSAALLAAAGHSGYVNVLEEGFFPAYLEQGIHASVLSPLEKGTAIESCYLKPYPGCRHMHASLEAFSAIMAQNSFNHGDIKSIMVGTYRIALETGIRTLSSRGDAYFNIPYAIAARAVLGEAIYDSFDERHFQNPAIVRLMGVVTEQVDAEIESLYPGQRGARVEIGLADGRKYSYRVNYPLGEPESPLSQEVTRNKFLSCTERYLIAAEQNEALRMLALLADPETSFAVQDITRRFFFLPDIACKNTYKI